MRRDNKEEKKRKKIRKKEKERKKERKKERERSQCPLFFMLRMELYIGMRIHYPSAVAVKDRRGRPSSPYISVFRIEK